MLDESPDLETSFCHQPLVIVMSPRPPWSHWGFPTNKILQVEIFLHGLHPFPTAPSPRHFFLVLVVPTPRQQLLYRSSKVSCHLPWGQAAWGKWHGFLAGKKRCPFLVESRKLQEILNVIDSIWRNIWLELASLLLIPPEFSIIWLGVYTFESQQYVHGFSTKPRVIQHGPPPSN